MRYALFYHRKLPRRGGALPAGCLAALLLGLPLAPAGAQPAADPDWPCVQVLVPEVSAGVVWPVPIDASVQGSWKDEPGLRSLAEELGTAEQLSDEARERIAGFVEEQPDDQLAAQLNRLADGILEVANRRRDDYLRGIQRYTRQQRRAAETIEAGLNRLASDDAGFAAPSERADFEEALRWQERIYDQRERAIASLCEQPVELEQTLSATLREVAGYLP